MGVLTSYNRVLYLKDLSQMLEQDLKNYTDLQNNLIEKTSQLHAEINDIGDSDSASVKVLKAREQELEALDRKIQREMTKIQTRLQATDREIQDANQMLQKNIQTSFSYSIGR